MNNPKISGPATKEDIVAAARSMLADLPGAEAYVEALRLDNLELKALLRQIANHLAYDAVVNESKTFGRIELDTSSPDCLYSKILAGANLKSADEADNASLDVVIRAFEQHVTSA